MVASTAHPVPDAPPPTMRTSKGLSAVPSARRRSCSLRGGTLSVSSSADAGALPGSSGQCSSDQAPRPTAPAPSVTAPARARPRSLLIEPKHKKVYAHTSPRRWAEVSSIQVKSSRIWTHFYLKCEMRHMCLYVSRICTFALHLQTCNVGPPLGLPGPPRERCLCFSLFLDKPLLYSRLSAR